MFKSKAPEVPEKTEEPVSTPAPPESREAETPRQFQHSFIGTDTKVTGDITSRGDISIEGAVEGDITCRTLTLRGEPNITGDVHAEAVHVCGRFTGALHAKKVVLTKAAKMNGDIHYETLELQDGAEFEGGVHCTRASASKPVTKNSPASAEPTHPTEASQPELGEGSGDSPPAA